LDKIKNIYEESKTIIFIIGIISWVMFLIIPLPAIMIDMLLVFTLAFAMIILIQASTIDTWEKFRTFPLILLMSTIFRIALNIATMRKIISGEDPGAVIESAGHLIVRDQIAIGIVMFVILIIVQFIIAMGANRFGEVSARFMLDALPGKQMSIDNDLNQGSISPEEGKRQKQKLQQQADFYGSLDGAGKYIKGDVWASVAMILVNLIVGLIVGIVSLGLSFGEAAARFTLLSVGDGVINLIAALMITVAGAIVMAKVEDTDEERTNVEMSILQKIFLEIAPNSRNLYVVGGALIILGMVGLPFWQLLFGGLGLISLGIVMQNKLTKKQKAEEKNQILTKQKEKSENKKIQVENKVEPITIEVGYKLAPLFKDNGFDVLGNSRENIQDKIQIMRQIFANRLGVSIPKIKIRDNVSLQPSTKYEIKVKETTVAQGILEKDKVLAIPSLLTLNEIEGDKTKDPIFGQDAIWITEDKIDEAMESGYNVWNPLTMIATHLHEILEKNIWQFITLQEVSNLINGLEKDNPILKEKMEKVEDLYLLQKVIISLLKEKVSIKDFPTIVEAFLEVYAQTKEVDTIVSIVRQRISRQICENYINADGKIYMIALGEEEKSIELINNSGSFYISMDYSWQENFISKLKSEKEIARLAEVEPILLVRRPELRAALSRMLETFEMETPVISIFELPTKVENEIIKTI
jgi:flagellar biosynthesis protein FlhA